MIKRICMVYFSGTGTTEKVVKHLGENIKSNLGIKTDCLYDFTPKKNRDDLSFNEDDLVIVGLPTIAGRVPNLMLKYLDTFKGNGCKAVAVMTFGNRNYDDSLMELTKILEKDNMKVIAGGAFSCEHSFSTILGKGRPDKEDLNEIAEFAVKIGEKIKKGDETIVKVSGNDPVGPYYMPQDRNGNHIDIRKVKPKTTEDCIKCGLCVRLCPTGAIDEKDPSKINGICMKCCACIKKCPKNAKYFDDEGYLYHKKELEEIYGKRRAENALFI